MYYLKKLFCFHIWENVEDKDLNRTENQIRIGLTGGTITGKKVKIFARTQTCIKCRKTKIIEIEKVI